MNKLTKTIRATLYAFCLVVVMSVTGCDFSELNQAVDDFAVVVELKPINTNSTVLLTDAKTGELITNNVVATFGGDNGSDVIDMYSDPITEKEVSGGILNFGIDNSVTPSSNSPAQVRLTLSADGYETTTRTVSIDSEGSNSFSVKMIDKNNRPQGVTTKTSTEGQVGSNGSVQNDFNVTVNSNQNPNSGVLLQVSSGTVLKDGSGNTLSGQLTTNMSYYDPAEPGALESFPGELVTKDGNGISTAGIFTMQVQDENGNVAFSASSSSKVSSNHMAANGNATITLSVPSGYINLSTGDTVKEGDEIFIFKGDNDGSKSASFESEITTNNSGDLVVEVPAFTSESGIYIIGYPLLYTSCAANISLDRNGYNGGITGRVYSTGISAVVNLAAGSSNNNIRFSAPSHELTYQLYTSYDEISGTHNFCSQGDLNLTLDPPANLIDATVDVSLQCENPDEAVNVTNLPGASVVYRDEDATSGSPWTPASNLQWDYDESSQELTGGSFDVSGVTQGESYTFILSYDDKTEEDVVTVDGSSVDYTRTITDDICQ